MPDREPDIDAERLVGALDLDEPIEAGAYDDIVRRAADESPIYGPIAWVSASSDPVEYGGPTRKLGEPCLGCDNHDCDGHCIP